MKEKLKDIFVTIKTEREYKGLRKTETYQVVLSKKQMDLIQKIIESEDIIIVKEGE
jgi:hypothetical protein